MELVVSAAGVVTTIYDEALDLRTIGRQHIVRASHVEPDDQGRWSAAIVDGPTLGPFDRRSAAIAAEIEWLTTHWPVVPCGRAGSEASVPISPRS